MNYVIENLQLKKEQLAKANCSTFDKRFRAEITAKKSAYS